MALVVLPAAPGLNVTSRPSGSTAVHRRSDGQATALSGMRSPALSAIGADHDREPARAAPGTPPSTAAMATVAINERRSAGETDLPLNPQALVESCDSERNGYLSVTSTSITPWSPCSGSSALPRIAPVG